MLKRFPIVTRRYDIKWITTILLLLLFFGWFGEWSILFYFLKGATLRRKWVIGLSRLEWCVAQSRVGPFPLPEIFGLDQFERFDLPARQIKVPAMLLPMPVSLKTLQRPKTNGIQKCRPFNRFQTKTQTWLRSIFSTSFIVMQRVPMRERMFVWFDIPHNRFDTISEGGNSFRLKKISDNLKVDFAGRKYTAESSFIRIFAKLNHITRNNWTRTSVNLSIPLYVGKA